ncbi:hypothetical protein C438_02842 [Haloferax denitrificans ATCC 35960]|uniref:Uncharacterized protein n=1 Tax=Haloferax denitrificans ATCC 35960 TaxID=662478 RepID=M0JGD2_9EURY|nr:hypothetical protein C438_02842 [Haloferax denitrificans ATCC 35960]
MSRRVTDGTSERAVFIIAVHLVGTAEIVCYESVRDVRRDSAVTPDVDDHEAVGEALREERVVDVAVSS